MCEIECRSFNELNSLQFKAFSLRFFSELDYFYAQNIYDGVMPSCCDENNNYLKINQNKATILFQG